MLNLKPRRLDTQQPYSRVQNSHGQVLYRQDDLLFYPNGKQVGVVDDEPVTTVVQNASTPIRKSEIVDTAICYETMHWTDLKALVEMFGGVYKGVPNAINFLKGNAE